MLLAFKNSETIKLKKIICTNGLFDIKNDDKPEMQIPLCKQSEDVLKSTFICYIRNDGKIQESRLDKLYQVR